MSQGKTRQVPELLKYCGVDFPTATSGSQTFDCPVIKIFLDGIKFASFETVLSGCKRARSKNKETLDVSNFFYGTTKRRSQLHR